MKVFTFKRGGVHPPGCKTLSEHKSITPIELPDTVGISLNEHLGKPAVPIVKKGQDVVVGECIANPDGFISAFIHSSVAGKITKIDTAMTAVGALAEIVTIDVNKEKTAEGYAAFENRQPADFQTMDTHEILQKIKQASVVGLGGAAFPTNIKLSPPTDKTIDTLLINGAECEPYLTADHQLMLEEPEKVLTGILIVQKALDIQNTWIGIETNKRDAIKKLQQLIETGNYPGIKLAPLKTKYPQGGEKQLISAVTNREVPSGKLPFEVGCVVQNIGTMLAIYEAVCLDKPLIERIITITGFVKSPGNYRIPIGVPFRYAIEACGGGFRDDNYVKAVINGGPMMGKTVRNLDVTTMKGTSGILVLSDKQYHVHEEGPCIRCGRCVDDCPMGLMPTKLASGAEFKRQADLDSVMDCIECGTCSYICPTRRQLVHWIRLGKTLFRRISGS